MDSTRNKGTVSNPGSGGSAGRGDETAGPGVEELIRLGDGGPLPADGCRLAYRRFEEIARSEPDLTAVVRDGRRLSYGQLDAQANRLARRLRELGVGPEQVVAICLPRQPEAIVAVYAVHKAGAAYLPLDPGYPVERRRFMLEDSGARVLIAYPALEPELTDLAEEVVEPPRGEPSEAEAAAPDWDGPGLDNLAYLIYTSGSTGRPKGVMIEQGNLAAFVSWGVATFTREELSALLGATSLSFDMSGFELFVPLCAGGSLVQVDNVFAVDSVADQRVTMINTVPSLMAALLRDRTLPETAGTVCFCGETLPPELSERVHAQPGVRRVVNTYGPTEDTIYSTGTEVAPGQAPTIGRPFPGTQAYVMDESSAPLPSGVPGELYLGGAGLARGYHGREELTRERFVPNPLPGAPSARLYRTGDLARWEPDGVLQHLGRIDHQVKIRGVRIEPSEVEGALAAHPRIGSAVVMARPGPSGEARLIAWVEPDGQPTPTAAELREMLRRTVPEPMVPSAFVTVGEMPLNANGKLDRDRLPDPPAAIAASPVRGELETALAELWMEVLGLESPPGPDDDFFALGGQSLIGFHLFELIARRFGRELPASALVEASTLRGLAECLTGTAAASRGDFVSLNADGGETPFLYLYAGPGGPFTLRHLSKGFGPDRPAYGIGVYGDVDGHADERSIAEIGAAEVDRLRELQPHGPYLIGGHSTGGSVAFEMACLLTEAGERVDFLGLFDQSAPHTMRWRGRAAARGSELLGVGPEGRRPGLLAAAARRAVHSRYDEAGPAEPMPGTVGPDWLRALRDHEREYRPRRYPGDAVVFTTQDTARYTGSRTLGWDRYVDGGLEVVRIPGDHLSILVNPNIEVLVREVRTRIEAAVEAAR
ncbi:MAG TPA: amino acid adenylation domain-containing protein [Thermoleophilaceae bacterium]|jgi:amino acid adenylation domain-containing protein